MDDILDLHAITADDLKAICGCVTQASIAVGDIKWSPRCGTLCMDISRMMWERRDGCLESCDCDDGPSAACYMVKSHICLGNVTRLQSRGVDRNNPEKVLQLQRIDVETKGNCPLRITGSGPAVVTFCFSDGAGMRVEVDGVDCYLSDTGNPVPADIWVSEGQAMGQAIDPGMDMPPAHMPHPHMMRAR